MTSDSIIISFSYYVLQTTNVLFILSISTSLYSEILCSKHRITEPAKQGRLLGLELGDLATPLWVLSVLNRVLFVFTQLMSPEARQFVRFDRDWVVGLVVRHSRDRNRSNGESGRVVETQHRPWGRSCSFLDITENVKLRHQ